MTNVSLSFVNLDRRCRGAVGLGPRCERNRFVTEGGVTLAPRGQTSCK